MLRPVTAGRRGSIGTASGRSLPSRMKTAGRMTGTAPRAQQAAFLPSHEVNVSDRPVTGAGRLAGMKNSGNEGSLQYGRQIHDSNYYVGHLRTKEAAILKETAKLEAEIKTMEKEAGKQGMLGRTFEDLLQEVRGLEGTLADYNLAIDKTRSGTDPEEIMVLQKRLASKNKQLAGEIDQIFLAKQQREKETSILEREIADIHITIEETIQKMEPNKMRIYKDLMKWMHALHEEGRHRENEINRIRSKINDIESDMRGGNDYRDKYKEEKKKSNELREEINQLREDLKLEQMDPKDAHAYLLNEVKKDQQNTTKLEGEIKDVENQIKKLSAMKDELHAEINEKNRTSDSNDTRKNEELFQKDRDMTEFLEKCNEKEADILRGHNVNQSTIVALLEDISSGIIASEEEMPSNERFEELKEDVSFKTKQLKTSEQTMTRLQVQKNKRLQEMEKINMLEEKIITESQQLDEKMEKIKTDIENFDDLQSPQERAEMTKDYLVQLSEKYTQRIAFMKNLVKQVAAQYDRNKAKLSRSDTWRDLGALEQKLRHQGQNIFVLEEYIATKGKQTDFESLKKECFGIVDSLNSIAVENS